MRGKLHEEPHLMPLTLSPITSCMHIRVSFRVSPMFSALNDAVRPPRATLESLGNASGKESSALCMHLSSGLSPIYSAAFGNKAVDCWLSIVTSRH